MADITFGSSSEFDSSVSNYPDAAKIDSTHFIVAYSDGGTSGHGTARIATFSGDTITSWGTANVFNAGLTQWCKIKMLDASHFVIAYTDKDDPDDSGQAVVGTISGTTITYLVEEVFNSATTTRSGASAIDSETFIISYDNTTTGDAIIGTIPPPATAPTLAATTMSNIEAEQADAASSVTSDGGATITERGFVYSESANPVI